MSLLLSTAACPSVCAWLLFQAGAVLLPSAVCTQVCFCSGPTASINTVTQCWHGDVCTEDSGPVERSSVACSARNHFTHHFSGNYLWAETSQLIAVHRRIMQQLSEGNICRKRNHRKAQIAPVALTPVASYCFLNLEALFSELQMASKLMNKYEMSSQGTFIYMYIYTYTYTVLSGCAVLILQSALSPVGCQMLGLFCAKPLEGFLRLVCTRS